MKNRNNIKVRIVIIKAIRYKVFFKNASEIDYTWKHSKLGTSKFNTVSKLLFNIYFNAFILISIQTIAILNSNLLFFLIKQLLDHSALYPVVFPVPSAF